jgi:hypothetical protein
MATLTAQTRRAQAKAAWNFSRKTNCGTGITGFFFYGMSMATQHQRIRELLRTGLHPAFVDHVCRNEYKQ